MANNLVSIGNIRKKFHKTHELISTSYHEGAHVIYGLLHLINIESATVFENRRSKRIEGYTEYHSMPIESIQDTDLFNEFLHAEICLSYAGLVAEKRLFKMISGSDKFPMFLRDGSSNDIKEAAALFQKYSLAEPGRQRYNYKQTLIKAIDKELQEHWDAISLISHNLFKKKTLLYSDIKNILIKKSKNKEFWKKQFKNIEYIYENDLSLKEKDLKSFIKC